MIQIVRRFAAACCAVVSLVLAGCGHVPVATMYKLWTYDVASADPAHFRAAVRYPSVLVPRPAGVVFLFSSWTEGESDHQTRAFVLEEAREPAEAVAVARFARSGDAMMAYRLSDADVKAVRKLQLDHRAKGRASPGQVRSEMSVKAEACRNGDLPKGAILSSTYLKLDANEGYLTVLEDVDLRSQLSAAELETNLPACSAL